MTASGTRSAAAGRSLGLPDQGFATGLSDDYNENPANEETPTGPAAGRRLKLGQSWCDNILHRDGRATCATTFLSESDGKPVKGGGRQVPRGARAAGYTADPQETVNYFSAHDNHPFWDYIEAKAPFKDGGPARRIRRRWPSGCGCRTWRSAW